MYKERYKAAMDGLKISEDFADRTLALLQQEQESLGAARGAGDGERQAKGIASVPPREAAEQKAGAGSRRRWYRYGLAAACIVVALIALPVFTDLSFPNIAGADEAALLSAESAADAAAEEEGTDEDLPESREGLTPISEGVDTYGNTTTEEAAGETGGTAGYDDYSFYTLEPGEKTGEEEAENSDTAAPSLSGEGAAGSSSETPA
ncbi:MAG: hypothetical protein Q4C22_00660, partial [Bacillota bacterium]|nr:hypothetical protein [Bacillota bacterium]